MMAPKTQYSIVNPTESKARKMLPAIVAFSISTLKITSRSLTSTENSRTHHLTDVEEKNSIPPNMIAQRTDLLDRRSVRILIHSHTLNREVVSDLRILLLDHSSVHFCARAIQLKYAPQPCCHCRCSKQASKMRRDVLFCRFLSQIIYTVFQTRCGIPVTWVVDAASCAQPCIIGPVARRTRRLGR